MIPAKKSAWFESFFGRHARGRIARTFEALRARGVDEARAFSAAGPLVVVSNHTAWWDPLVAIVLSRFALGTDAYAMMDAANLRRLPFFGKVGAFGVDLADPRDGARAMRYAVKLLDRPGRLVWIFAQGRERPITEPLAFRPGAAEVARLARLARVLPVGLRYEFGAAERPVAWVSIGPPLDPERDVARARAAQERAVAGELARIDQALRGGEGEREAFAAVVRGDVSPAGDFAQRALAWMTD